MKGEPYWTDALLERLENEIRAFERIAFETGGLTVTEIRRRLRFAVQMCMDNNVSGLLGRATGHFPNDPRAIRREISLARQHIETLRYLRDQQ